MNIQENFSLKNYNTFGIDVSAKYFAEVTSLEELREALNYSKTESLPILFLGGGSNVLFTRDFNGLVIHLDLKGVTEEISNENEVLVISKAGENWHEFVQYCLAKNYGGLENLSLIPGNVGTSPMQNIGAYGTEIKDTFLSCKVLNLDTLEVEEFDHEKCNFGYRESIFKREGKGKYVILEVVFKLTRKNHAIKTEYGAIKSELEHLGIEHPTIHEVSKAVINIRQSKLPDPAQIPNCGSFFKNPIIPTVQFSKLQQQYPDIVGYTVSDTQTKVAAGWLIEQAGLKGQGIAPIFTHDKQALVLTNHAAILNLKAASQDDILVTQTYIQEQVFARYGIMLQREPVWVSGDGTVTFH